MKTIQLIVPKTLLSKLTPSINKVLIGSFFIGLALLLSNCLDDYRLVKITSIEIDVIEPSTTNPIVGQEIVLEGSYTFIGGGHQSDFNWTVTDPSSSESWYIKNPRLIFTPLICGTYKIELEVYAEVDKFIDRDTTYISLTVNK
jgi:hypothetical protein